MKVNFLGDLHCNKSFLFTKYTIQVGDLCAVDYKKYSSDLSYKRFFIDGNHENFNLLNTNASKPYELHEGLHYIPRGYFSNKVLFIGGAGSVDFNIRMHDEIARYIIKNRFIENIDPLVLSAFDDLNAQIIFKRGLRWEDDVDPVLVEFYKFLPTRHQWFPEEEISNEQLERILKNNRTVETVVAHDCPYSFLKLIVPNIIEKFANTNKALEEIFKKFKPKLWIFGHHHKSIDFEYNGCRFICLGINEAKKIDVPIAEDFFL